MMKKWQRDASLFGIGAVGYSLIELAFRGRTHWTMAVTGGGCAVALYRVHTKMRKKSVAARCAAGAAIVTGAEFFVGLIVNRLLGWNVWDYSERRLNVLGQICPRFTLYWFLLNLPLIPFFSILRRRVFERMDE